MHPKWLSRLLCERNVVTSRGAITYLKLHQFLLRSFQLLWRHGWTELGGQISLWTERKDSAKRLIQKVKSLIGLTSLHQNNFGWPWLTFVTLTHIYTKIFKSHISETITATATLSCTVIYSSEWLKGVDGTCDYHLHKMVKTPWSNFSFFRFQYRGLCRRLDLERSYFTGWQETAAAFAFWPTLTYFCNCDTHWNNGLRPPSAYRGCSFADNCNVSSWSMLAVAVTAFY